MFHKIVAFVALAALLGLVSVRPGEARVLDLNDVLNKTVCPIKVEIDINEHRVPRKIKMLKCAEEQREWCQLAHLQHECCRHSLSGHVMQCVEVHDTVLVFDKIKNEMVTQEVPVGCSCIVVKSTETYSLKTSPPR
ncbi:unnamed protein product [Pieris brassicae]|uniref:Uncharacterized protein n=1 Tax=Pieris brassicae TaxID=7116 RepID=A0A9P0XAG4_PIEBR|nr:unnamed protein product [Pieris brassicae]